MTHFGITLITCKIGYIMLRIIKILYSLHYILMQSQQKVNEHIKQYRNKYYRNFSGDSIGQVEAVDVGDVVKWRQILI